MAVRRMVVVVRAVEVGRHHADVVRTILTVEELTVLEAGNLCQRIGLIGLFQLGGQQAALLHGLGCHARIDAGGAEEFQLLAAVLPRSVNDVHLQNHVVVHEIRQRALVGHDAAHLRCSEEHILRLFLPKERFHSVLPGQIQFFMGSGDDIRIALTLQLTDDGRAHHAAMACYIDFCVFLHHDQSASRIAFSRLASLRSCFAMISTSCS